MADPTRPTLTPVTVTPSAIDLHGDEGPYPSHRGTIDAAPEAGTEHRVPSDGYRPKRRGKSEPQHCEIEL